MNNWLLHILKESIKVSLIPVSLEQLIYLFLTRCCLLSISPRTLQRHPCPLGRQNYLNKDECSWGSRDLRLGIRFKKKFTNPTPPRSVEIHHSHLITPLTTQGRQRFQGFLPQLDEFYFTTVEKKLLEKCTCIVPNFITDYCNPCYLLMIPKLWDFNISVFFKNSSVFFNCFFYFFGAGVHFFGKK
jgi:hypothetical protein